MCGYNIASPPLDVKTDDLIAQIGTVQKELGSARYVKIFTSGSFTDPNEIPHDARSGILQAIHDVSPEARVLIESRPEFISNEIMKDMIKEHSNIEVALGLESADDRIRQRIIGKRFSLEEYFRAADAVSISNAHLKTYLVLKPPFLSEFRSIEDTIRSIAIIAQRYPGSTVSINPINVQIGTPVEGLFDLGLFRPPWLWSVAEVLRSGKRVSGDRLRLISYPTGAGRPRGAHNCGKCDQMVLDGIHLFDLMNDVDGLPSAACCHRSWSQAISTVI